MNSKTMPIIKPGSEFVFKGIRCVVTHLLDLDEVLLTDLITGEKYHANVMDLQPIMHTKNERDLMNIEDEAWHKIQDRFNVIKPLLTISRRTRQQVRERAEEFNLHANTVYRWIKQAQTSGSFKEKDNRSTEENELIALRKELQRLKMENDILKQAALILGRK